MLQGFKKYEMANGTSTISVSESGVAFSKACIIRMGKPDFVELLIDYSEKRIAIQVADENTEGAFPFYKQEKKSVSVRWNSKDLIKEISKMMGWDLHGKIYRANGEFIQEERATIFDMNTATCSES